ncbi:contractile injection system tape measure protein [Paucibacter sp. O1-1]|nr:contractile injection system tape measure protein [Paucibacter sp. O1-1]MDA3827569.1 contractile injection system tape measure protein [Paucibacter sp. O1-1]
MRAVIDSLVWDARFASEGLAWQQQERLRRFLRGPGLRTLQARLQAQMPADGRVLHIDRLELDLGRFTPDAPLGQWAERLDGALLQALQRLPGSSRSRDAHELAQFSHYLQQGALPWSARSAQDLAGWLARLARRHGPGLWEALQRLAPGEQVLQRLALITPHGGLQALIAVRAPELAAALELLDAQWLNPLQARGRLSLYQRQRLQQALRVAGLRALWGGATLAGPRLQGLIQALIQAHAELLGPAWAALANGLPRPTRPRSALARQLLQALWPDSVDEHSPTVTPQQRRRSPLLAAALAQLDEALNGGRAQDGARLQRLLLGLAEQLPQELPLLLRAWAREGRRRRGWAASLAPASLGLVMHLMQASEPASAAAPLRVPSSAPSWMESLRQFALRMLARPGSPPLTLSALQQHLLDHSLQTLAETGRLPQTHAGWQALWQQGWQRLQQDDAGPAAAAAATEPAPDWGSQLDALLAAAPQRWSATQRLQFSRLLERESDAERWLARYRPAQRWALLNQAAGREAATLQACSGLLQRALQVLQPQAKAAETERQHWRWLLRPLLIEGQAPRPETLVRRWAMQLHRALPQGSLARCFARLDRVLAGLSAWADPVLARLRRGLRRAPSRAEHYELGLRVDRPAAVPPARPDPVDADSPIYIADAGLVMLAAYAERLFGRLALLEAGRFKSPAAQSLAVAALGYLAAGHEIGHGVGSEAQQVLAKLLCGVPPAQVLPAPEPLGEERRALLDALLGAVIAHWKAVGNTSVEGLRQSFLRRGGRLTRKPGDADEQAWRLLVEPKPFDLLLDRLPWSFSTIRLPWMTGVLHVDWR